MSPHNGFLRFTSGVPSADLLSSFYVDSKKKKDNSQRSHLLTMSLLQSQIRSLYESLRFFYIGTKAKAASLPDGLIESSI